MSDTEWYAFFEMKNLALYRGEIGVAVSRDQGATWAHMGTALARPFHLSFPLVLRLNTRCGAAQRGTRGGSRAGGRLAG